MSKLDEFLEPLHHGVWEVRIPKESVTEQLDNGWEKSAINIPTPGTIASFRKGQYHVHETETEWRVHLDRYDPKIHPILHLVDDAPLLLMIAGVVVTLLRSSRGTTKGKDTRVILEAQERTWQQLVLIGVSVILVGFLIISDPLVAFRGIVHLVIPLIIICLGILVIGKSINQRLENVVAEESLFSGLCIFASGIVAYYLPLILWAVAVLAILAAWMFSSAFLLLKRVTKGRTAVPEGFLSRLIIGALSLGLVTLIFLIPVGVLYLLLELLALIAVLSGITLVVNGLQLRERMKAHMKDS